MYEYPFGPDVRVYKVCGKMFALVPDAPPANHPAITPGYHLNKAHWNTIALDGSVPAPLLREMIVGSYELVVSKLSLADRRSLSIGSR